MLRTLQQVERHEPRSNPQPHYGFLARGFHCDRHLIRCNGMLCIRQYSKVEISPRTALLINCLCLVDLVIAYHRRRSTPCRLVVLLKLNNCNSQDRRANCPSRFPRSADLASPQDKSRLDHSPPYEFFNLLTFRPRTTRLAILRGPFPS